MESPEIKQQLKNLTEDLARFLPDRGRNKENNRELLSGAGERVEYGFWCSQGSVPILKIPALSDFIFSNEMVPLDLSPENKVDRLELPGENLARNYSPERLKTLNSACQPYSSKGSSILAVDLTLREYFANVEPIEQIKNSSPEQR